VTISPIAIATHGLLNSPLSVAAVRGHLIIDDGDVPIPPIDIRNPGGDSSGVRWKSPYVIQDELRAQLEREDEEILAIIMAAVRILD